MNLNSLQLENFLFSLDYYNILKSITENLLTYIKNYRLASIQYSDKLKELSKNYKINLDKQIKEIKIKKKIDLSKILFFINIIHKIIDTYNENLLMLTEEIEKEIKLYEGFNPDLLVPTCSTQFGSAKDNLLKKEKEFQNLKNTFLDEMTNTEDIIYKYYSLNIKNPDKENEKSNEKEKNIKNIITEDMMNKQIIIAKNNEDKYKKLVEEGKKEENNFIQSSRFFSESVKKITSDLFKKLKHLILNFLMSMKNNMKVPQIEIDSALPDLIKLDNSLNIVQMLEKYYNKDNNFESLFKVEKYNFQFFNKNKDNKDIKENKENKDIKDKDKGNKKNKNTKTKEDIGKIKEIEDGFERMYFIEDEPTLLTFKKMINNFELVNMNNLNIETEEEKFQMNNLTTKLLSSLKKEKDFDKIESEKLNITSEDIKTIEFLLENHHNVAIFFQKLNKFRSTGRYIMRKEVYDIFGKIFNKILDKIKLSNDKDIFATKNIIILSQTYYKKDDKEKEYLQNTILNHKLLKNPKFWEELFVFEMSKEIQKISKIEMNNNTINNSSEDSKLENNKNKFSKLAFGQIMTLSNNMIEFGLQPKEIYKIMEPKIKYYQLSKDLIISIKSVLGIEEEEKRNDNEIIPPKENKENKDIQKNEIKDNENKIEEDKPNNNEDNNNIDKSGEDKK